MAVAGMAPDAIDREIAQEEDNWVHRTEGMLCKTCMYYVRKAGNIQLGRCRRHAPTMAGFPVVFPTDWCGDHKLDESAAQER